MVSTTRIANGHGVGNAAAKAQQGAVPARLQGVVGAKPRDSLAKENGNGVKKVESRPAGSRRQSSASALVREKGPSKDGTAQRTAKEVEGLRNFVSLLYRVAGWDGRTWDQRLARTGYRLVVETWLRHHTAGLPTS